MFCELWWGERKRMAGGMDGHVGGVLCSDLTHTRLASKKRD